VSDFLSEEWLLEVEDALADLPEIDGVDGIVQYVVSGAPDGKVQFHAEVRSGRLVAIAKGKHPDPQCAVTLDYADAVALFEQGLRAEVAFMSGRAKVEGDHRVWLLDLRPLRRSDQVGAALAALRDTTST
jgi:hypothetical protein